MHVARYIVGLEPHACLPNMVAKSANHRGAVKGTSSPAFCISYLCVWEAIACLLFFNTLTCTNNIVTGSTETTVEPCPSRRYQRKGLRKSRRILITSWQMRANLCWRNILPKMLLTKLRRGQPSMEEIWELSLCQVSDNFADTLHH